MIKTNNFEKHRKDAISFLIKYKHFGSIKQLKLLEENLTA